MHPDGRGRLIDGRVLGGRSDPVSVRVRPPFPVHVYIHTRTPARSHARTHPSRGARASPSALRVRRIMRVQHWRGEQRYAQETARASFTRARGNVWFHFDRAHADVRGRTYPGPFDTVWCHTRARANTVGTCFWAPHLEVGAHTRALTASRFGERRQKESWSPSGRDIWRVANYPGTLSTRPVLRNKNTNSKKLYDHH